jgi:hypothetical protein
MLFPASMEFHRPAETVDWASRFAQLFQKFAENNRLVCLIALSIAALHAAMSITATEEKSPTFDEPAHLTAGYSYWLKNDFRLHPENGTKWALRKSIGLSMGHRPN